MLEKSREGIDRKGIERLCCKRYPEVELKRWLNTVLILPDLPCSRGKVGVGARLGLRGAASEMASVGVGL